LLGLDFLLVFLHFLARSANLIFYHVELRNYTLNLARQLIAVLLSLVVAIFRLLCGVHLVLNFSVDFASVLFLDVLNLLVIDFHRLLVLLLFSVVDFDGFLNLLSDLCVFLQLSSSPVLFKSKLILNHCHLLLEAHS